MSTIQLSPTISTQVKQAFGEFNAPQATTLPTVTQRQGETLHISAESQYLFDMYKYLNGLDATELNKALDYLSGSKDPLHSKAIDHFLEGRQYLDKVSGGKSIELSGSPEDRRENLLDKNVEINGKTEIGVMAAGVDVFRLDGNKNFSPVIFGGHNDGLNQFLDSLQEVTKGIIGNRDHANLFGSVRNALVYSENIMLSFDDVLHYNYAAEKARTAIDFIDAPEELKLQLTEILERGIVYQNTKQSEALTVSGAFTSNSNIGQIASGNIALGKAAQHLNSQLQSFLKKSDVSILNSQGLLNGLLMETPELIRFTPNKLSEALEYYKQDYVRFDRALNGELSSPSILPDPELDKEQLLAGSKIALKVITDIKQYVSNQN